MSQPPASPRSWWLHQRTLVVAVFVLIVLTRLPTLFQPLLEKHDWRQTQTAFTALIYSESGIDLLHPQVPVLGPPFVLPFEFPLFQAIASIPMTLGVPPDVALRVVCLVTFLASAALLWGLVRHVAGPSVALATLIFFAFSPLGLVWSRASMIEYLATAGALGMVWAGIMWRERGGRLIWLAAFAAAMVTMLVKPTTGIFYLLPLMAYHVGREDSGAIAAARARLRPGSVVLVVVPVVAALLWTRYADGVKASSVLTAPYTSEGLFLWNFGTLPQRLQPGNWIAIARRVGGALLAVAFAPLVLAALVPANRSSQRAFWVAMGAVAILPILVLFNLYLVHDYYLVAISPAWAAILGLGAAWAWERIRDRRVVAAVAAVAIAIGSIAMFEYVAPIYEPAPDPTGALTLADELERTSRVDDQVLVLGREWSPSVHYYARRHGLAIPPELLPPGAPTTDQEAPGDWWAPAWVDRPAAQQKAQHDYPIMFSADPAEDPIWLGGEWPWMGVLGPHTYVLGDRSADLRGARLTGTDVADAANPVSGTALIDAPVTIRCDADVAVAIPAGKLGTWLSVGPVGAQDARLQVVDGLAPILAKRMIVVDSTVARPDGTLALSCTGAESIVVSSVVDAPAP